MKLQMIAALAAVLSAVGAAIATGQDDGGPGKMPALERIDEILDSQGDTPAENKGPAQQASPQQPAAKEQQSPQEASPPELAPSGPTPATPTLEQQVDGAIRRMVELCFQKQEDNGGWGGDFELGSAIFPNGKDVHGLMVLAYGDVDANDSRLENALRLTLKADLGNRIETYVVRILALSRLHSRLDPRQKQQKQLRALVRERLAADVEWLIEAQQEDGRWDYLGRATGGLASLGPAQQTILALSQAETVLEPVLGRRIVSLDVWRKTQQRYLETQREDGGWNSASDQALRENAPSGGLWTAGGVTSLLVTREKLFPAPGCPCKRGRSQTKSAKVNRAIERGAEWLAKNFDAKRVPGGHWEYYLWCFYCQRAARGSGLAFFGPHDWRSELISRVVAQRIPGGWHPRYASRVVAFLAEASEWEPPLVNKLRFPGQWNNHPDDMRNLTKWLSAEKKEPLGWQAVPLEAPLVVWHEAPILYISAEEPIVPPKDVPPEEEEAFEKNLRDRPRRYTDTGGTILFEATCGNTAAARRWETLCKKVWPEWAPKGPRRLDKDHPLWSADVKTARRPILLGIDDGLRTCVFASRADISCDWNTNDQKKGKPTFELGRNLYAYATDRQSLARRRRCRRRGVGAKYAGQKLAAGPKQELTVARLQHGGDWDVGRNYRPCECLAAHLKAEAGVTLKQLDPVAVGAEGPEGLDLLYLCGRTKCDLGLDGTAWLKKYLADGGFLFAEAWRGGPEFDESFRAFAQTAGLAVKVLEADCPLVTGRLFQGAAGYCITDVAYAPALQEELKDKPQPRLQGIYRGQKLVGIYSPYDILFSQTGYRAFGNRGYAADDARALATNLVLLMTAR